MTVGDFVRLVVPEDRRQESFARGRVVAIELYTDFNGPRTWVCVQWFDHDGKPDKDNTKHHATELEAI